MAAVVWLLVLLKDGEVWVVATDHPSPRLPPIARYIQEMAADRTTQIKLWPEHVVEEPRVEDFFDQLISRDHDSPPRPTMAVAEAVAAAAGEVAAAIALPDDLRTIIVSYLCILLPADH